MSGTPKIDPKNKKDLQKLLDLGKLGSDIKKETDEALAEGGLPPMPKKPKQRDPEFLRQLAEGNIPKSERGGYLKQKFGTADLGPTPRFEMDIEEPIIFEGTDASLQRRKDASEQYNASYTPREPKNKQSEAFANDIMSGVDKSAIRAAGTAAVETVAPEAQAAQAEAEVPTGQRPEVPQTTKQLFFTEELGDVEVPVGEVEGIKIVGGLPETHEKNREALSQMEDHELLLEARNGKLEADTYFWYADGEGHEAADPVGDLTQRQILELTKQGKIFSATGRAEEMIQRGYRPELDPDYQNVGPNQDTMVPDPSNLGITRQTNPGQLPTAQPVLDSIGVQQQAVKSQADIQEEIDLQTAKEMQKALEADNKIVEERKMKMQYAEQQTEEHMLQIQNKLAEIDEMKIDGQRFLKNSSDDAKVGMAIGIILSGLSGKDTNGALNVIDRAIERDIQLQMKEIDKSKGDVDKLSNVVSQFLDVANSEFELEQLGRVAIMDNTIANIQNKMAGLNSTKAKQAATQAIAQLEERKQGILLTTRTNQYNAALTQAQKKQKMDAAALQQQRIESAIGQEDVRGADPTKLPVSIEQTKVGLERLHRDGRINDAEFSKGKKEVATLKKKEHAYNYLQGLKNKSGHLSVDEARRTGEGGQVDMLKMAYQRVQRDGGTALEKQSGWVGTIAGWLENNKFNTLADAINELQGFMQATALDEMEIISFHNLETQWTRRAPTRAPIKGKKEAPVFEGVPGANQPINIPPPAPNYYDTRGAPKK